MWVWYRTSEGCPDGEAFVSRLSELGKTARLASVGDRVDFVVTLGSGPQESSGRIERQTRGGERWPRDPRRLSAARRGRSLGALGAQPTAISADGRVLYGTGTCGGVPTYYRLQLGP